MKSSNSNLSYDEKKNSNNSNNNNSLSYDERKNSNNSNNNKNNLSYAERKKRRKELLEHEKSVEKNTFEIESFSEQTNLQKSIVQIDSTISSTSSSTSSSTINSTSNGSSIKRNLTTSERVVIQTAYDQLVQCESVGYNYDEGEALY